MNIETARESAMILLSPPSYSTIHISDVDGGNGLTISYSSSPHLINVCPHRSRFGPDLLAQAALLYLSPRSYRSLLRGIFRLNGDTHKSAKNNGRHIFQVSHRTRFGRAVLVSLLRAKRVYDFRRRQKSRGPFHGWRNTFDVVTGSRPTAI